MLNNPVLKFITSLFILVAISASIPAFADAVQNGELLKIKAQENDPASWMKYGEYLYDESYDNPELRDKFRKEAYSWIRKAADSGLPEAIFSLGYYEIGDKAPLYYYEQAAFKGYAPAFERVLDAYLFLGGKNIKKAKEFADLARKMKLEDKIPRDLDIVDICYQAGIPEKMHDNRLWPGAACDECAKLYDTNTQNYKKCIFERGNNIDIATLHANGQFVKQDFWKAISYVCQGNTSTPYELTSMVKTLFEATQTGRLKEKFDWCNHVSSSQASSVCFLQKQDPVLKEVGEKFKELPFAFTAVQKSAYDDLLHYAFIFFNSRAHSEQDLTGSLRSIFITEWDRDQKKWLLEVLELLEAGKLKVEKADYSRINHEMQEEYKKLKEKFIESEKQDYSFHRIFDQGNIESTQEDFLVFRDAFAHFIHIRYPNISFENAKSWITKIRIKQLKEL